MITTMNVRLKDLAQGYEDKGDEGVIAFGGELNVRPAYQREFVYDEKHRNAVVETVLADSPLGVMYWVDLGEGQFPRYELLDGQQRTISICAYMEGDYSDKSGNTYDDLSSADKERINSYVLRVEVLKGMTSEQVLEWFRKINVAPVVLNEQELRNSAYTGKWLYEAKKYFSKANCAAYKLGEGYLNGSPVRQDYLETALGWVADRDGITIEQYMARHKADRNAADLKEYFEQTLRWVKSMFPKYRKQMKGLDWAYLRRTYANPTLDADELEERVSDLMLDDEVTNKRGIYEYVLGGDSRHLSIRTFTESQKAVLYERCGGICPMCRQEGGKNKDKVWKQAEMDADHIVPWINGGKTTIENGRMLCRYHNRDGKARKDDEDEQ